MLFLAALSFGDAGSIQLTSLPTITVADGRSTVTLSAYVRRPSGQPVPDGTQVVFQTSLGSFKDDSVVQTVNGVARTILQSGSVAGTAKITASALSVGAVTTLDIEFLGDRSMLSSAKEYIEVYSPSYLMFSLDDRVLVASGANRKARLRYQEVEIFADDIQVNVPMYEVRAKHARLKIGKFQKDFDQLNLKLTARRGAGITTIVPKVPISGTAIWELPWFYSVRPRVGVVEIHSSGVEPITGQYDKSQFDFQDISDSTSLVSAKKAVVFPQKDIQFQKAEVMVGGVKVLRMPLYDMSLTTGSNIATDQMIGVQNNQLSVNYPYYLSLGPGESSVLRLTTGTQYGRTSGVDNGLALSYEMNWNRGASYDGGFALSSLTSRNWDLSAHQFIRFDESSSGTAFLDMPEGRSVYGSLNFSKQFDKFGMSLNGSTSNNIRGNRFSSNQLTFVAERDPVKMGPLPFKMTFGVNASANATQTSINAQSQNILGVHLRTQLVPQRLDKATQLNGFFTMAEQTGRNSVQGLAFEGNLTLSRQFGSVASGVLGYEYLENGFSSGLTGRHQLSFSGGLHLGNLDGTLSAIKALDVDKLSLFADTGYRLSDLWRLSYSYTLDRYLGSSFSDYTAALGYRIGTREIGLTYSQQTKRFGIQLLGTGLGY